MEVERQKSVKMTQKGGFAHSKGDTHTPQLINSVLSPRSAKGNDFAKHHGIPAARV